MKPLTPKRYQDELLRSVEAYFRACRETGDARKAYHDTMYALWGEVGSYRPLTGFDAGMPYFCLRVPTGGGKTRLAARSVALVNRRLLENDHGVILWLVPSSAIRDQTLRALRDREHPYHADLLEAGPVTVVDLDEAKTLTPPTYDTSTVVIVATAQSFRQQDMDKLKVYEGGGALMDHFRGITKEQREQLLRGPEETVPYSFANVLRLRRPFVIVDEAHNARTELQFETLARFRPAGILELTATPDLETTPSNVLHSVSAADLKAESMIKLPILLEAEPDWQKVLAYAIDKRAQLQTLADRERAGGAAYLRPLVLIQSQPRSKDRDTLHAEALRDELIRNHHIPENEIAVATGETRDLAEIDLFAETCPIRYIITQQALAEGWDCSFAYVLASVAEMRSETRVEQLLGRILRQPDAERRATPELNRSYAFVASRDFGETARALRDRLVQGAGFDRADAWQFVAAGNEEQARLDFTPFRRVEMRPVVVALPEKPDLTKLTPSLKKKVKWDGKAGTLTINEPIKPEEDEAIARTVVWEESREAVGIAAAKSRTEAIEVFRTPSERGLDFRVPRLGVRVHGELQLFDDPGVLDYPWELPVYQADPSGEELGWLRSSDRITDGGEIDVEEGAVRVRFLPDLTRDLDLSYTPDHLTEAKLGAWLCRNVRETDITDGSLRNFVAAFLAGAIRETDLVLANRQKFLLRGLLERKIADLRREAVSRAYQEFFFTDGVKERVTVDAEFAFEFHPDAYSPTKDDPGAADFAAHYYPRIGAFDSDEERQCALWLDRAAQKGLIQFWVRNLVRKATGAFFLPTATGKFHPDFLCRLPDGRTLVVESKGADRWKEAEGDRKLGELWAELSGGQCLFVMVKDKRWDWIEAKLG